MAKQKAQVRTVGATSGFSIFERTAEGRLIDVKVRREYDDRDTHPFSGAIFHTMEEAVQALKDDKDLEGGRYLVVPTCYVSVQVDYT